MLRSKKKKGGLFFPHPGSELTKNIYYYHHHHSHHYRRSKLFHRHHSFQDPTMASISCQSCHLPLRLATVLEKKYSKILPSSNILQLTCSMEQAPAIFFFCLIHRHSYLFRYNNCSFSVASAKSVAIKCGILPIFGRCASLKTQMLENMHPLESLWTYGTFTCSELGQACCGNYVM